MSETAVPALPDDARFLAVDGVIGVGKSSLAKILAEKFSANLVEEQFAENPFLPKFYDNPEAFAVQTQIFFLLSRLNQFQNTIVQNDLFHHLVISDYTFEKDRIFAAQNLSESELAMYDSVSNAVSKDLPKPDLVIYLQAPVEVLLDRIAKRGIKYEQYIDRAYLERLLEAYTRFCGR